MMATDDKVAFYLRHRTLIEEWAALRGQAATALETIELQRDLF